MGNWFGRGPIQDEEPLVVLVTGASSGMGKSVALDLISRGEYIVYGAARRVEKMKDLVEAGGHAIEMDITNDSQVSAAVKRIIQEQGRIDILFNNCGYGIFGSFEDVPMTDFRQIMEVNFFGAVNLTQKVIPYMRKREIISTAGARRRGLIINNSSVAALGYGPFAASYTASKHALESWSDCLRVELSPWNIHVAIIQPGYVKSDIFEASRTIIPPDSVYAAMVNSERERSFQLFTNGGHDTSVVNKVVLNAIQSKVPRRRYLVGFLAYPAWFLRTFLGDGLFDFLLCSSLKP